MAAVLSDTVLAGELLKLLLCLLMDFVLNAGKVHGDIAAVGEAQGLDHVNDMQLRVIVTGDCQSPLGNFVRVFAQIHCHQDFCVISHRLSLNLPVMDIVPERRLLVACAALMCDL
jgi:hypothetical protein